MSDTPKADRLLTAAKPVVAMLEAPEYGLSSWHLMFGAKAEELRDVLLELFPVAPVAAGPQPDAEYMASIRGKLDELVHAWLDREAPRVRDEDVQATIKFTILQPAGDEDNALVLDLRVEERTHHWFCDDHALRVEGVAFDTEARS